jgi:hypothetical protein
LLRAQSSHRGRCASVKNHDNGRANFSELPLMKRPGTASTVWFIAFVAVSILLFRNFQWTNAEMPDRRSKSSETEDMIFGIKVFYELASARDRLPESRHFAECDVIFEVMRARSV